MTKHLLYFIMLFLLPTGVALAQTGSISGSVKTSDGTPAEMVNVTIKGSNKGTFSDAKGNYRIKNVNAGTYTIIASFIGLESQEQSVTVTAGNVSTVGFLLKESAAQLQEVIVSTKKERNNTIVAKMPLKYIENPQVYNSVSSEVIKQQAIVNYDDAMRNVPGISRTWESTGRGGDGGAYFALRGFEAQPSIINGLPGLTSGNLDIANVEEIQVIKGPSATLFGGSFYGYGGIINTITKKPYYTFGGEVAYNIGSFGLHRVTADINTPLSKTEKIALRINTAYHTEGSFQDAGNKKSFFIAPSLTYEVNDRLTIMAMAEILQEKRAVAPVFFHSDRSSPLDYHNIDELNLDYYNSFTSNDLTIKNPRLNFQGQVLYKLSKEWNSQTVISAGRIKSDGIYTYIYDNVPHDNFFDQSFHNENQSKSTIDIQQNFNGDFKIGGLRNRLLVGLDYYRRHVKDNGSGWVTARQVSPQGDVKAPVDGDGNELPLVPLNRSAIDALLAAAPASDPSDISNSTYSAYASNVLNITPSFMAMISGRIDRFDSKGEKSTTDDDYAQTAFSPKIGLLYQPILNKVSVFVNYMNAFVNVEPAIQYDSTGTVKTGVQSFKPEHANQWEFGVKTSLFNDKLNATISYYNIGLSNRVVYPPLGAQQTGKVRSKGFEIDINAAPAQGLTLIAGYSHNSSKVESGNGNDFYNEVGRAAGGQGPADQVNLWANYKFVKGSLKDFGFGIGGNYASKYRVIDNSVTGTFDLPSYTLLNGGVFYSTNKYRVNFNMNNITDTKYYIGYWSVNPQRPRNFTATVAYKF